MYILQEINRTVNICFGNSFLKHTENARIQKRALETESTSVKLINHFEDLAGEMAINILYAQLVVEGS